VATENDAAALWQEISKLKEAHSDMRVESATIAQGLDAAVKAMTEVRDEVKLLRTEMAEQRGAKRIAALILGTLISLGVPAAWIAHVGGQK
jgi:hypothetical protein